MQQAAGLTHRIKSIFTFERIFFLILIIAFILRFLLLDLKLLHHDEAIHSWFCYELLTKGAWQYDPSYHGPFLYFVTTGMFALIGPSDFTARLLPSLFGFAIIPLVYCIYRIGYISKNQTLVAALLIAISPDMVYFSRFLRHDIFMLFFTMLLLVAILYYFERGTTRFAVIAAVAAACALSCKEEMPVIFIVFVLFFAFAAWKRRFVLPPQWKADLLLFVVLIVAIISVLYLAFFHTDTLVGKNFSIAAQGVHFEMNTTGWYQAVDHWVAMHEQQRLGGPLYFYIPLFLLYELPIFILALVGTIQFMTAGLHPIRFARKVKNWIKERRFTLPPNDLATTSLQQLRDGQDVNRKSEEFFRFCIVWMIATMAFYAYVGEKVPWLIIPQLLPMCFVATYKLNWQKTAFALAGCIFLIVMTWHVAFVPADINEPIIQVQNSEDMREVMGLMDNSSLIVIASKDYWPLPWYYRGSKWDKIQFYGSVTDQSTLTEKDPGVIILHDSESFPSITGYRKKTYKLSYWFSFYDNDKRLAEYYLRRDGKMGSINIDVFTPLPAYVLPPDQLPPDVLPVNVT